MKLMFKIVMFTFMLNIACGMINFSLPDIPSNYKSVISPISDQTTGQTEFIIGLGGNVSLPSTTQSSLNIKDVLLDSIFIGKIIKFVDGVKSLLFGFPEMLYNSLLLFTPADSPGFYLQFLDYFRTLLSTLISIGYGLGIFFLWTGKRLDGG